MTIPTYQQITQIRTSSIELIEISISQVLGVTTKLRISFSRSDLKVKILYPFGNPSHLAIASQETASEAEATKGFVEMAYSFFGDKGHGVSVQGQESQVFGFFKGRCWYDSDQIESKVQNLQLKSENITCCDLTIFFENFVKNRAHIKKFVKLYPIESKVQNLPGRVRILHAVI